MTEKWEYFSHNVTEIKLPVKKLRPSWKIWVMKIMIMSLTWLWAWHILPPEKVDSLTDKEDVNDNTEKSTKLPFEFDGLVEINTNVEEMKDVKGLFYVNVLSQMFHLSNLYHQHWKFLQNSRENTIVGISFLMKLKNEAYNFIKKRLWYR